MTKLSFWVKDWALGYMFMQRQDIPDISLFPKTLSIKSFVILIANNHTHFTCGKRKI